MSFPLQFYQWLTSLRATLASCWPTLQASLTLWGSLIWLGEGTHDTAGYSTNTKSAEHTYVVLSQANQVIMLSCRIDQGAECLSGWALEWPRGQAPEWSTVQSARALKCSIVELLKCFSTQMLEDLRALGDPSPNGQLWHNAAWLQWLWEMRRLGKHYHSHFYPYIRLCHVSAHAILCYIICFTTLSRQI